jgi:hypothetical protein
MAITLKASTANFFDKEIVIEAVGAATAKVLSKFGSLVRKRAQKSLHVNKNSAPAGSPPFIHTTRKKTRVSQRTGQVRTRSISLLREYIWFSYDKQTNSVVIGPVRLDSTVTPDALPALEYGGSSTAIGRKAGTFRRIPVTIKPHPFMAPAFEAEQPGLAELWAGSVSR